MIFIPLLIFFALLLALTWSPMPSQSNRWLARYFLGERNLKGFVLAMTLVATYGSVSSFVSGPGLAWHYGLGWVVFAAPQIITGFFILGILGKKLALIARAINAVTIIDVIRARYPSRVLPLVLALALLIFFTTMMVGQFIGGAQIFSQASGLSYETGLLIFGALVVFYTTIGGFRAVALTDTVCALLMLLGMFFLGDLLLNLGGGLEAIMTALAQQENATGQGYLLTPNAQGALPWTLLFSAWILVGFGTVALPQSAVRCMAYRSTQDLHQAMIIGTTVCGALMIGMTLLGVLAHGVIFSRDVFGANTDALIPYLIAHKMDPMLAGVTLIGPLAATMSTVSSLLLSASSAVVKDLFLQYAPNWQHQPKRLVNLTRYSTFILGVLALVLALKPLDLIAWINMFAFGGLELAFLCPLLGGVFWRRASTAGALTSVFVGLGSYLALSVFKVDMMGFHAIVPSMALAILTFILVSFLTSPERDNPVFFP